MARLDSQLPLLLLLALLVMRACIYRTVEAVPIYPKKHDVTYKACRVLHVNAYLALE